MGHLLEKQGVQLVLAAIPEIIKHIPDFKFIIIGDGQYKVALTALARELNVASYCDFKGKIDSHVELENEIAKSCVAIAPYVKKLDTWTYYADPGKVKTYLACGVPVLLSSIPWNAAEIAERGCGRIISENPEDIARQAVFLMNYSSNQTARDQAIRYSQNYNYANLFGELQI
jgi:glycosyltransferase involved in cell wall biosynthesis